MSAAQGSESSSSLSLSSLHGTVSMWCSPRIQDRQSDQVRQMPSQSLRRRCVCVCAHLCVCRVELNPQECANRLDLVHG